MMHSLTPSERAACGVYNQDVYGHKEACACIYCAQTGERDVHLSFTCLWRSRLPWADTSLTCSLFEVLGQGKESTVYKGRKKQTICYFAIKRVPKDVKARVLQEVGHSFTDGHISLPLCVGSYFLPEQV